MDVIAVVSQKGGSGKTTLTGHLSVQAHLSGHGPVAVIDTDPQGSLAAWWNEREAEAPLFVQTTLHDLRNHLENLSQAGVKAVFVDTPPAITGAIHEVISVADYIIVPTKPSPHDLRAVGATVKLVEACNKPMVFVLNDASSRAKITYEAAIALSQHGTVAPVTVHHRTLFASSMIDGRTAQELEPNGQSATEILGLWEYINARLNSEVMPTAIGLDAGHRHDGAAKVKQPFAATPPPAPMSTAPAPSTSALIEDDQEEVETPSLVSVQPVKPQAPVLEVVHENTAEPDDLWKGFAEPPEENSTDQLSASKSGTQRLFGRRQFGRSV